MENHELSVGMDIYREDDLLEEQGKSLDEFLQQGRKKAFEEILGRNKKSAGSGQIADEWEFIGYEDAGNQWRKESKLVCECGRKLRYQYTLRNKTTGLIKSFGLNHLTEHTGIQPEYARQIVKRLACLEKERLEIIKKWKQNWTLEMVGITQLPPREKMPLDISWHLAHEVPLLEKQLHHLHHIIREENFLAEEKKLQQIVAQEKEQLKEDRHL